MISFPHLGNYHVPIEYLLQSLFQGCEIRQAPPITAKTLELGSRYSPDFVCVPFKYNLGNFIEALEGGANVLIQAGGGCRYGYYAEVQEQILRDLGYDFEFICLFGANLNPLALYRLCRRIGCSLTLPKFMYCFTLVCRMVTVMDRIERYIRENIGFEQKKNSFDKLHQSFLSALKQVRNLRSLAALEHDYDRRFKALALDKPEHCLRVGVVGELYTLMEPFSNFHLEKELAEYQIISSRFITLSYLLFHKARRSKKTLGEAGQYLKYKLGADGTDSVATGRILAEAGYDGLIHVKPFGCTPEVNAMPMLQNIGRDYQIPILYFSFDSQTSETGVKTRLEAFNDMLVMRRQKKLVYESGEAR